MFPAVQRHYAQHVRTRFHLLIISIIKSGTDPTEGGEERDGRARCTLEGQTCTSAIKKYSRAKYRTHKRPHLRFPNVSILHRYGTLAENGLLR